MAEVKRESLDVLSFVFEAEDRSQLPAPLPGQFLILKVVLDKQSVPVLRSYSISGPQNAGTYRVSVKRGDGEGSRYLHDHISSGDLLQVSAPRGNFILSSGSNPIVLLSAGIGVTPVLSMLHSIKGTGLAQEIWWCYGVRNGKEHPFAAEARGLLDSLPHGHSFVMYSQPAERDQAGRDYDAAGHLSLSALQKLGVPQTADFYLCGPTGFLADFTAGLKSWGIPGSRIHSEAFGAGSSVTPGIASSSLRTPHPPAGEAGTGPSVCFTRSGLTVPWNPRFASLLEFAEACDVSVRWSCRSGVCHMCESGLIDGSVGYNPEPLDRPAQGNILICCSTPASNVELDL